MSTEPEQPLNPAPTHLSVLAADRSSRSGVDPVASRATAQLQAQIHRLEDALSDATRCLEDAECRAAELLAARARAEELEAELLATKRKLDVIVTSRSWRLTSPLRRAMQRGRPATP